MIDIQSVLDMAHALHQQGKLAEAHSLYRRVLAVEPKHPAALNMLGVISAQTGDLSRAIELMGMSIATAHDDAACYFNRGRALLEIGELTRAAAHFDIAVSLRPDLAIQHYFRGATLHRLKQLAAAVESYNKAIYLAPGQVEVESARDQALEELEAIDATLASFYKRGLELEDDFLLAYYRAAGLGGDARSIWRKLAEKNFKPPRSREAAETAAQAVRRSPFFDPAFYARRLPQGIDPALHYVLVGESLGWAPSESFDPGFYFARYPDVRQSRLSPLSHYTTHGRYEGRRPVPAVRRLQFPSLKDRSQRPVLIINHEASRTGAPILGWNLSRGLNDKRPVVTVLMRGGPLTDAFVEESDAVIGPLTVEEWHPVEIALISQRIAEEYKPLYAISNSIEASVFVPALAGVGIPSVSLVHEFASYTRPLEKLAAVCDWAAHVVFPAEVVANSVFEAFPSLRQRRGVHILTQGKQQIPSSLDSSSESQGSDSSKIARALRAENAFVVLCVGQVIFRKGVDLFLAVASAASRLAADVPFKFVWIGNGYDPVRDIAYSAYLKEHLEKAGLENLAFLMPQLDDLEPIYEAADVFFLSSRLDPQPNVGIDALMHGLPVVCFEGASGTADILASEGGTSSLVVPYLDVDAAAREICRLASDREMLEKMGRLVVSAARKAYDQEVYCLNIDRLGVEAAESVNQADLEFLVKSRAVDPDLALPPYAELLPGSSPEQRVMLQWSAVGASLNQETNVNLRRPVAGFHPQAYAVEHFADCCERRQNPTVHWLRRGRPEGSWSRRVFSPLTPTAMPRVSPRIALHAHFYYPDLARDLLARLEKNETSCDLFVSTDHIAKAALLEEVFAGYEGRVTTKVMPNRGRDIGPFLTGFREEFFQGDYDLLVHIHGKKSLETSEVMGNSWRSFLWDNLIGGEYAMLDLAVAAFASDPNLGLLMAEDPHLVGWGDNRAEAERLLNKMGISHALPDFFDFPLGTMFWCRPQALRPLLDLGLSWNHYPEEPLPYDGTILHSLERLLPFVVQAQMFGLGGLRAPGTTW